MKPFASLRPLNEADYSTIQTAVTYCRSQPLTLPTFSKDSTMAKLQFASLLFTVANEHVLSKIPPGALFRTIVTLVDSFCSQVYGDSEWASGGSAEVSSKGGA
jgi:hypothetical protein